MQVEPWSGIERQPGILERNNSNSKMTPETSPRRDFRAGRVSHAFTAIFGNLIAQTLVPVPPAVPAVACSIFCQ